MDDDLRADVAQAKLCCPSYYADCAVPILLKTDGSMVSHGTGTLFRMADHKFLVTAAHVVVADRHGDPDKSLFLVAPSGSAPIPLCGKMTATHFAGGWEFDPHDIALVELADPTASALSNSTFLCQADIEPNDDFADDYYFVVGFPTSWARMTEDESRGLELLTYFTQPHLDTVASSNYRPDWHLLLRRAGGERFTGERAEMPASVCGMSGGSVWRTYYTRGGTDGSARVVAVQTSSYRSETMLKSIKWGAIAQIIYNEYPDLRPATSLVMPRRSP